MSPIFSGVIISRTKDNVDYKSCKQSTLAQAIDYKLFQFSKITDNRNSKNREGVCFSKISNALSEI